MTTPGNEKPQLVIQKGTQTSFTYQAKKYWGNDFVQINTHSRRDFDRFTADWNIGKRNGQVEPPQRNSDDPDPGGAEYKWCEKHQRRYNARFNQCYLCSQEQGLLNTANEH